MWHNEAGGKRQRWLGGIDGQVGVGGGASWEASRKIINATKIWDFQRFVNYLFKYFFCLKLQKFVVGDFFYVLFFFCCF